VAVRARRQPDVRHHLGELIEYAWQAAKAGEAPKEFEIHMLYGICRDLQCQLVESGHPVRGYIPCDSGRYP
jgi:proline dehydrogenase